MDDWEKTPHGAVRLFMLLDSETAWMTGLCTLRLDYLVNARTSEKGNVQLAMSPKQARALADDLRALADLVEVPKVKN